MPVSPRPSDEGSVRRHIPAPSTPVTIERRPRPDWPHRRLDVAALVDDGWQPVPFEQFVLKVHSRCNLSCTYCYMYRSADQTWRRQPGQMSQATVVRTAERIAEHAAHHGLRGVEVVLHGGEPLLAGPDSLAFAAATMRSSMPAGTTVRLSVQTNGTLLDRTMLDALARHDVRVGVSLDGGPTAHDARRPRSSGHGSHGDVSRGLALLGSATYRHLFAGLLCVVDLDSDPVATYEALVAHRPPTIDFLLPHANWSDPPRRRPGDPSTAYGDWLIAVFDRWCAAPTAETSVRLFDALARTMVGRTSLVEVVGLSPATHVVVETDGSIEQVDALKSTYHGAARTGLDVHRHAFDAALADPQTIARQIGVDALAPTCRRCDIHRICGGGYYPHRYRRRSGFHNPSVYCRDLMALIRHMQARVEEDVARLVASRR